MDLQIISKEQITQGRKLGEGGFGVVYAGTWDYQDVAIKTLHLTKLTDELEKEFMNEVEVMSRLSHPAVIHLYGICKDSGYAMILEYMSRGDLYELLQDKKQALPWNPLRWQLAIDIGGGLTYLHKCNILHRDLKSLNILLDQNLRAKLTDFGLSRIKNQSGSLYTKNMSGSVAWMAPELFERRAKITPKADVYAYGMILWEIAARKVPFSDAVNPSVIPSWIVKGEREDIPQDCPKGFADVIQRCWAPNSEARPTAFQALQLLAQGRPQLGKLAPIPSISKRGGFRRSFSKRGFAPKKRESLTRSFFKRGATPKKRGGFRHSFSKRGSFPKKRGSLTRSFFKRGAAPKKRGGFRHSFSKRGSFPKTTGRLTRSFSNSGGTPITTRVQRTWNLSDVEKKQSDGASHYRVGMELYQACKYRSALPHLKAAAAAGYPPAYLRLFRLYRLGGFVGPKQPTFAEEWKKKAAETIAWFQEQAKNGRAEAQFDLGYCYYWGIGIEEDETTAVKYYQLAADQGYAFAQYHLGLCYHSGKGVAKDVALAAHSFKLAADQGDVFAQFSLGFCYDNGEGVGKDIALSAKYYKLAADQGHASAQYNLGVCYDSGEGVAKDFAAAAKYYKLAADQGNTSAQYNLGNCYRDGRGVAKDFALSAKYYKLAADQGSASAQCNLGFCYGNGQGVAKDFAAAAKYYKQAADQGHAFAQSNLGLCYEQGTGVAKDFAAAAKYYKQAADQGDASAQYRLGNCYRNGWGVAKDIVLSAKYYKQAADQGNAFAQYNLGVCYQTGQGVAKDFAAAAKYYKLAADQGYASAQNSLGLCYKNGTGVAKDFAAAAKYYKQAADQGDADAQVNLGNCYDDGQGVARDIALAAKYYKLAADQGSASAQCNLGYCYNNGEGVGKDIALAAKYYKLAADQGNVSAQYNLGNGYECGHGVAKDVALAAKYYKLAAEQGHAKAKLRLQKITEPLKQSSSSQGTGLLEAKTTSLYTSPPVQPTVNSQSSMSLYQSAEAFRRKGQYAAAVKSYTIAAEHGDRDAQYQLGMCYVNGTGVKKSKKMAKQYLKLAADKGHNDAKKQLKKLGRFSSFLHKLTKK